MVLTDGHYIYTCMQSTSQTAFATYIYFLIKIFDLIETVMFVLRKKFAQISVLHVYHHIAVLMGVYVSLLVAPGGHSTFIGFGNLIVHAAMYTYYFLSAYDSEQRERYAKFKIHLTQMQIVSQSQLKSDAMYLRMVFLVARFNSSATWCIFRCHCWCRPAITRPSSVGWC